MVEFNEAKLRGINMRKLRQESFTSQKHLSMVAEHELKSAAYWNSRREQWRPKFAKRQVSDTPKVQPIVEKSKKPARNVSQNFRFTPEQLRIAMAVAEKEGK